ncbi:MAG TPA: hypothetical protein VGA77_11360 [Propylenella sp.]
MKRIMATGVATLVTAMIVVAASSPANASHRKHIYFGFGGAHGWGHHGWDPHGQVYIDLTPPAPVYVAPAPVYGNAHVQWCAGAYVTYNPATNLYFYAPGKQRHCDSPYN